jgi:hypothetical protein
MSDNLRTRIAKVLYAQLAHPVPLFDSQPDEVKDAWLADADAVIDLLIDMAGKGELLKAIDGMYR